MSSQTLRQARKYEVATAKLIPEEERPGFHLSAYTGWMNDPNGFSYYKGQYHLFYQYYPYDTKWGPMHWAHAVSKDLLHWEFLPAALAPDDVYDRDGCFSGSAIEMPNGKHLLMYTGVLNRGKEDDDHYVEQTQCIAIGDGEDYEKYSGNPVIGEKDLPEGAFIKDFRDPKLWRGKDGMYYCVIGSRPADKSGQILLYRSEDALHWEFVRVLIANQNRFGKMWECPDFFELDGKWVLLTSPQDMLPEGFEYHNGNGTLCLIGDMDEQTFDYNPVHNQAIDYGIDFYAPQTTLTPDGRRIMIGWMQNWDTISHDKESKWFGQMSLPREITICNGRLYQQPVRELEQMRRNKVEYHNIPVSEIVHLPQVEGRRVDMELTIRAADLNDIYTKFTVCFAQNEQFHTKLSFHPRDSILKVDRKFSGTRRAIIHQRRSLVNSRNGELKLRLILDRFSVECFVNDGEQTMTATLYTPQDAQGISFLCDGNAVVDVVKYDLM